MGYGSGLSCAHSIRLIINLRCSKHLQHWNKISVKCCAPSWHIIDSGGPCGKRRLGLMRRKASSPLFPAHVFSAHVFSAPKPVLTPCTCFETCL